MLDSYSIAEIAIGVVVGGLVLFVVLPVALVIIAAVIGGSFELVGTFLNLVARNLLAWLAVGAVVCAAAVSVLAFGVKIETVLVFGGIGLFVGFVVAAVIAWFLMLLHSYKSQLSKFARHPRLVNAAWISSALLPIAALGIAGTLHEGWTGFATYLLTFSPMAVLAGTHLVSPLLIRVGQFLFGREKVLSREP